MTDDRTSHDRLAVEPRAEPVRGPADAAADHSDRAADDRSSSDTSEVPKQPMDDRTKKMYWRFAAMIATSTVAMFVLMYFNTYRWDHVQWSETRFYMALVMGSTMAVIMLLFMIGMYKSKVVNTAILGAAVVIFASTLWLVRSQTTVQDASYMRAMIPHHSIAILTSERSELTDLRVLELADEIILAQRREIAEMKWLINDIQENGEVRTQDDLQARPVPEFTVTNGRDELSDGD